MSVDAPRVNSGIPEVTRMRVPSHGSIMDQLPPATNNSYSRSKGPYLPTSAN